VLFSLIAAWVFGREYADRNGERPAGTAHFSSAIVLSKFVVLAAWAAGLTAMICLVGLFLGVAVGCRQLRGRSSPERTLLSPGGLPDHRAHRADGLLASAGHGYLPAMGFMFAVLLLAQVVAAAGWGEYFPWSIPILFRRRPPRSC